MRHNTHCYMLPLILAAMRGSRNFRQGGQGQSDKKALTTFFFFFLILSLFYRSQMANFKEIYHFSRLQRRVQHFPGGVQLFPGGFICLFPIETHITCDFPEGGPDPCPPSGSALDCIVARCLINVVYLFAFIRS